MVLIHGTNIVVDDFKTERPNRGAYVYFLSHFHRDCYEGIRHFRGDERIYCTEPTKKLLLSKYPHLTNVEMLDIDTTRTIFLDIKKTIYVDVIFFDSNHSVGSVMMLFSGYMGTILHTGHFRFTPKMLTDLSALYPPSKQNSQNDGCSIHIDELILDNTYCDPIFTFPRRNEAFRAIMGVINKDLKRKYCVALDTLGKEELLVHLAKNYKIQIVVDQQKFDILSLIDYYVEYFTLDPEASFLQVIKKSEIPAKLKEGAVVFVPTGLCNEPIVETEPNHFVIGYSLHSNYKELSEFLKSIRPAKLTPHSKSRNKFNLERLNKTSLNKFQCLKSMKQTGLSSLALKFCDHLQLSEDYRNLLDIEILSAIQKELGLDKKNAYPYPKSILQGKATSGAQGSKDKAFLHKKSLRTGEEESELLEAIEIEEELEGEGNEEEEEDTENRPVGAVRPHSGDREQWHQFYSQDRKKLGESDKKVAEDEKEVLETLGNPAENYIPFSDISDTQESAEFEEENDSEERGMDEEGKYQKIQYEKEMSDQSNRSKNRPHRVFTGMMTLSITQRQKGETSELKEGFSMYTFQKIDEEFRISSDMNLHDVAPYSEVEPFVRRVVDNEDQDAIIIGWVESERTGPDSLFEKLASHMKKKQIVRRCRIDDNTLVYFLHESQVDRKVHDNAPMIFLLISLW